MKSAVFLLEILFILCFSTNSNADLCSDLPNITGGFISANLTSIGTLGLVLCNSQLILYGSTSINCLPTGSNSTFCNFNGPWLSPNQCLQNMNRHCMKLPSVANGSIELGSNNEGSTRRVLCNTGFELVEGGNVIFCKNDGNWTLPGTCRKIPGAKLAYELDFDLYKAAESGDLDRVKTLLDEGANPYFSIVTRNNAKYTATHEASWDGSVRIVEELVRRFPNLTKYPDGEGFLLIHRAARNELFFFKDF